ncbi:MULTISPECIES: transglycosylase SLT domain-containing protein [Streptomyces]|uniref:transglycosylase SLT domain-containing protein n=1 Tax=Streptomyces TaxID=1883 RepID=UPI0010402D69|nr:MULTISPECIES: transglycosylase SLT domain-containing protein [Streptomyces]MBT3074944.1 transglycosylase SLT domain-containing protein [Streptomyces sp. COG21]MBT3081995.1 transglycosylase SLT domain-containing protein [Streptomyces sp. COG20]MBT3103767.1 transglycosylase SLT domain-containing protein [Streptomyces sp. COG19]MBT3111453.1 transglycosylase SLT domain-containing protein [Streptomyces sp. CYG20]MDI7787660.1 transglycosylase SLT domain-containing protein [Streptomyces cavourensi
MPAPGKHRRPKSVSLGRGIAAVTTGGAVLALPVLGATTASAAPAPAVAEKAVAPVSVTAQANSVTKAAPTKHSVVSGESLSKIARDYSVSGGWKKLYEGNRKVVGENPNLIHPGITLTVGGKAAAPSDAKAGKAGKSAPTADRAASADRADRSARAAAPAAKAAPAAAAPTAYTNDLDGWIKESLAVMAQHGIPGTYEGIHRNIIRESSGNPNAINNWDSNAAKGTPSKGLLQVIDPTFRAYHVPGTSTDSYDPVANIVAACNYAADRYGSIDNVFGAY